MMKQCWHVRRTVLRLLRWAKCTQHGSCWATIAVMLAGWPTEVCATPSHVHVAAAAPQRLLCASLVSQTKRTNSMGSTALKATTETYLNKV